MKLMIILERSRDRIIDRIIDVFNGFFESRKVEVIFYIVAILIVLLLSSRFVFKF